LSIIILLVTKTFSQVQDVVTTFYNPTWVENSQFNEKAALHEVKISGGYTFITIKIVPTKNKKRQNYWTSKQTYVVAGKAKLPLLGAVGENYTFHDCTYTDNWGWDNVVKGQTLYYTLMFSGQLPEGITNISLIDEAPRGRGYSFRNITINNPKTNIVMDEGYCRELIGQSSDGICGIYEEIGGNNYRLACIKEGGYYCLIYLSCKENLTWWFEGNYKAILEESATTGAYKVRWVKKNKTLDIDAYATFERNEITVYLPNSTQKECRFMKMYPKTISGKRTGGEVVLENSVWTGTGFSLTNNYIATNYHVIEDARSIQILGINGNFKNTYNASVVATDKYNDLAILKVSGCTISSSGIPYSVKTTTSEVGEEIFVLGYPLTSTMGDEIKLTTGVISSKTGFQNDVSQYQISAPIQPGNSGGPLFDSRGNIIGVVSAKHKGAENVGYVIKASYLKNLVESTMPINVLPQNNKILTLSLTNKVKSVKNYIYCVQCSSSTNWSSNNNSSYSKRTTSTSGKIYNNPIVNRKTDNRLKVVSVSVQDTQTVLTIACDNRSSDGDYYSWLTMNRNAYIVANGQKYTLRKTDGIAISPQKTYYSYNGETKTFSLYFPAIPKNTTSIDFVESQESNWKLYGIQLR